MANQKERISVFMQIGKFREIGLLTFIFILIIGTQLKNPNFLTVENIVDLLANTSILSMLALGMMLVIITRGIDLSIGATLAFAGMVSALTVAANPEMSPLLALLIGTGIGIGCGGIIGLLVAKLRILPIIATLGMMTIIRGVTYIVSGGKWVSAYQMPESFKHLTTGSVFGVRYLIIIPVIVYLIFYYFVNHTRTGRRIYAVGSNPSSAEISGINVDRILLTVYLIMGALAGFCGVLWVSKFASAQGDTATGYELNVIAACVLGGVSISGGTGKVSGVLLGSLLLGILNNSLPLINVSPFWQMGIQGLIILIAVIVNALVKRNVDRSNLMRRHI